MIAELVEILPVPGYSHAGFTVQADTFVSLIKFNEPRARPVNPGITPILDGMQALRMIDTNIYLRMASINIFNGMVSLTFSCDGSHHMRYGEFLEKGTAFWSGIAA